VTPNSAGGRTERFARVSSELGLLLVAQPGVDGDSQVRSFFDISPVAQVLLSPDRKVRVANAAAAQLFAPSGAALTGRTFAELFAPATRGAIEGLFLALGTPGAAGQRISVEGLGASGQPFPVELLVVRLPPDGTSGYGVAARDLRVPAAARTPSPITPMGSLTVAELLMGKRLRELV
jgi:PAS domain S-box-containing protein